MKNNITEFSIKKLKEGIEKKEFTSTEVIDAFYSNIENHDTEIQAFITKREKSSIKNDSQNKRLSGIPFSLKDAYTTKDIQTTSGSKVLKGYLPQYNATVYEKLLNEDALLFGKNSQDAWGHGSTSENTDFQIPKNPWNKKHVAGGSSGGSAAAVSARMVPFAIGEDTGGSIRNPSSYCGITGLKVTYGRVSRYGAIAYGSSLDTVGPMAKSVADVAYILEIIAGKDEKDATSSTTIVPKYTQSLGKGITGLKIGVPKEFFQKGTNDEVVKTVKDTLAVFQKLGAEIIEVSIPSVDIGVAAYYLLAPSETSSNLARYDGIRYGQGRENFTKETMRRIIIGTYALSAGYYDAYYKKALQARTIIRNDYDKAFKQCDLLLGPVVPDVAPKFGELTSDPIKLMLSDVYTLTQNIAGIPSLALPCGFSKDGLPIGFQIMGKMFDEESILKAGYAFQQETDWHIKIPNTIK